MDLHTKLYNTNSLIINENELQVGYNNEDITIFLPKELRNLDSFSDFDAEPINVKYSKK